LISIVGFNKKKRGEKAVFRKFWNVLKNVEKYCWKNWNVVVGNDIEYHILVETFWFWKFWYLKSLFSLVFFLNLGVWNKCGIWKLILRLPESIRFHGTTGMSF